MYTEHMGMAEIGNNHFKCHVILANHKMPRLAREVGCGYIF